MDQKEILEAICTPSEEKIGDQGEKLSFRQVDPEKLAVYLSKQAQEIEELHLNVWGGGSMRAEVDRRLALRGSTYPAHPPVTENEDGSITYKNSQYIKKPENTSGAGEERLC